MPLPLATPFSYTVPAGGDQSELQYFGLLSLQKFLGLTNCGIGVFGPQETPFLISLTLSSPTVSLSSPDPSTNTSIASIVANATALATTARSKDLTRSQKAAIGTAIPVGGTALLVLALFLFWQKTKRQRAKRILGQTVQEERTEDNPAFLQTKPELQGEDSRHEMLAEHLRFELDEGNTRHEMMTEEQSGRPNLQVQQQELRGEEFAHELDDRDTRA